MSMSRHALAVALMAVASVGIFAADSGASPAAGIDIASPDGRVVVQRALLPGRATYSVLLEGLQLTANYSRRVQQLEKVEERYELLTAAGARLDMKTQGRGGFVLTVP